MQFAGRTKRLGVLTTVMQKLGYKALKPNSSRFLSTTELLHAEMQC